jgi:iron complex transport system substrate-binding protein
MRRRDVLGGLLAVGLLPRAARAGGERYVCLGGALTEAVFALGAGGSVVGVDSGSTWPTAADALPDVGYQRALSAEGVLALAPTRVLLTDEAGPPAAVEALAGAVPVTRLPVAHDGAAAVARLRAIGDAIGRDASPLADQLAAELAEVSRQAALLTRRPRVLFVYARGAGALTVAGRGTAADGMIRLSGAINAMDAERYTPLTAEAALGAAPDVVLVTTTGLQSLGGEAGLWASPGLALTPAGAARRLVVHEDLALLGFGPRTGQAALALVRAWGTA